MLKLRFGINGWEDIMGIEEEVLLGMRNNWPTLEESTGLEIVAEMDLKHFKRFSMVFICFH